MARKATDQVTTIGIDIGKNTFHLIGLDGAGNIRIEGVIPASQVLSPATPARTAAAARSPQPTLQNCCNSRNRAGER
jgi:predicted NBD/HSP70 family sugar kinase